MSLKDKYKPMDDHDILVIVATHTETLMESDKAQWERINENTESVSKLGGRFDEHVKSPHCGEEDKGLDEVEKEAKEISKALVFLIRFCRSKAGKGTGLLALILGIIGAAKQLGLF